MNINGSLNDILEILSGVPQGWISLPILLNIVIKDLLQHKKRTKTHNYIDGNTLFVYGNTVNEGTKSLEKEAQEGLFQDFYPTDSKCQ